MSDFRVGITCSSLCSVSSFLSQLGRELDHSFSTTGQRTETALILNKVDHRSSESHGPSLL